jgi:hypothetical protein
MRTVSPKRSKYATHGTTFLTMASAALRTVLSPLLFYEDPTEENDERILNRSIWIWITAKSYVCIDDDNYAVDSLYHEEKFRLHLRDTHNHCLSIHASTLEGSIICLDYLVGLLDTHFQEMGLTYKDLNAMNPRLCPFGANILEKILQKSAQRICFNLMIFTPGNCRILASSGKENNIEILRCEFQHEGAAFVEASAARQDETSGPAKLRFVVSSPFNNRNWALFLLHHKLKSLDLYEIDLNSEFPCRAVATAQVQGLTLQHCDLEDEGAALVESISQTRTRT